MAAVACEACHVPKLYAPALQSIDWTVLDAAGQPLRAYRGLEGARRFVEELHAAFSNLNFDLVGQIAEDDSVVNLLIMNGLHTGPLLGHIPPSGREVVVIYSIIHRFEDGKLVEGVIISDQLSLMQQIGVVPTPVWGAVEH